MPVFETEIEIDTPFGYLEGVPAEFDVSVQKHPAEPTAWGSSRGTETEVIANLRQIHFHHLTMDVHEAMKAFGPETITKAENRVEETYNEYA